MPVETDTRASAYRHPYPRRWTRVPLEGGHQFLSCRHQHQWRETEVPMEGDRNTRWRETNTRNTSGGRQTYHLEGDRNTGRERQKFQWGETEIQVEGDRNSDQRKLTLAPAEGDISFTGGRRQNH